MKTGCISLRKIKKTEKFITEDYTEVYQKVDEVDENQLLKTNHGQWIGRKGLRHNQIKRIDELVNENNYLTGWCRVGIDIKQNGIRYYNVYYYRKEERLK